MDVLTSARQMVPTVDDERRVRMSAGPTISIIATTDRRTPFVLMLTILSFLTEPSWQTDNRHPDSKPLSAEACGSNG